MNSDKVIVYDNLGCPLEMNRVYCDISSQSKSVRENVNFRTLVRVTSIGEDGSFITEQPNGTILSYYSPQGMEFAKSSLVPQTRSKVQEWLKHDREQTEWLERALAEMPDTPIRH